MRYIKCAVAVLSILSIAAAFTGCTGSERLMHMTIVQAVGLDEKEGKVVLTLQYLDLNKGTGKNEDLQEALTSIVATEGNSIPDAVKNAQKILPTRLYFGQNKLLVISRSFLRLHEKALYHFLTTFKEVRVDVMVAVSDGTAKEVISSKIRGTRVPADGLCHLLRHSGKVVIINDYLNPDFNPDEELPTLHMMQEDCIVY